MRSRGVFRLADSGPCSLPPGDHAWLIREGRIEVYLASPTRRRLLAILEPGSHIFAPPTGQALSLVAPGGAVVEPVGSASGDELAVSAAAWMRQAGAAVGLDAHDIDPASPMLPAVQRFMLDLGEAHDSADAQRDAEDLARLARRSTRVRPLDQGGDRLWNALARAAAAVGAAGAETGRQTAPEFDDFSAVPQLARAMGFRARRVRLPADWHRNDLGPLIVRDAENELADALVWRRGHYVDAGGREIGATATTRFGVIAFVAYPSLPADVKGLLALGRFVFAGHGHEFGQVLISALASAIVGMIAPLAASWLFQDIVPAGEGGLLVAVGIAMASAALVQGLLASTRGFAQMRIEGPSAIRLAAGLTDRLLRLPPQFFRGYSAGDLGKRIQAIETVRSLIVGVVLSTGLAAVFSIIYLVLLFVYDARLAALALGIAFLYVITLFVTRLAQAGPLREAAALEGQIAGVTDETLEAVAKLRTAAAEDRALDRWRKLYVRQQEISVKGDRIGNRFGAFADGWQILTLGGIFCAAALLRRDGQSAGGFVGFLAAYAIFQSAFFVFCEALVRLMTAQPLAERAAMLFAVDTEGDAGQADPGRLTGLVEMSGVSFGYTGEGPPLLSRLSFTLSPGEHVAIVGGSGSGKSTMLRLLLGFETPRTGAIFFDGQDLATLDPARVRQQIGVVLQSSRLISGTILQNIRGANELSLEACLRAAERAGLAPDLALLPMGVHTPITDGAGTLSGGQRQRILIARAIAGDPRILFLDEATSALDNVTQSIVAQAIDRLDVARVTIAHRLSTVRNADRICVLSGGRIVETGAYDELFARGGVFTELAQRQLLGD